MYYSSYIYKQHALAREIIMCFCMYYVYTCVARSFLCESFVHTAGLKQLAFQDLFFQKMMSVRHWDSIVTIRCRLHNYILPATCTGGVFSMPTGPFNNVH